VDDSLDQSGVSSVSNEEWFKDMAISGIIGGVLGAGSGLFVSKITPAATAAQTLSKSSIALRVAGRVAMNAAIGGVLGGGIQVGLNLGTGKQWDQDVLRSVAIGAFSGAVYSGVADFQAYRGWAVSSKGLRPREGGFQLRRAANAADESVLTLSMRPLLTEQVEVTAQSSANISASAVERLPSVTSAYSRHVVHVAETSF